MTDGLVKCDDGKVRCAWIGDDAQMLAYHDAEWGRPVGDERVVFEKLCLEGFQAGLSWRTILHKRARFREVLAGFEPEKLSRFEQPDVQRLLGDAGIIRHRGKIEAAIANAGTVVALHERGVSLATTLWSFEPTAKERPARMDLAALRAMAVTPASERLSKALRKLGLRFVGPTTCYAAMQALGVVNDHLEGCAFRDECERARGAFRRP